MSTTNAGPDLLVLAPRGGGAQPLVRALAGQPDLAAFNDGGLVVSLLEAADGTLRGTVPTEGRAAFDHAEVADAVSTVLAASSGRRQTLASELAAELLQEPAKRAGKRRYALGAVGCAAHVDALGALFPGARIVHVVRDPRAVVLGVAHTDVVRRPLPQLASAWMRETVPLLLFGHANPRRVFRLPYESLLSDPQGTCQRLCRALELPPAPEAMATALREGLQEDEELVFQRTELDASELASVEQALQPVLALLGFRPATPPSRTAGDAEGAEGERMSLADEVAYLRGQRDRYADELEELRRKLADDPQLPLDVDVLRWKAKRYDRMRAAAAPLRVLKRLRARLRR